MPPSIFARPAHRRGAPRARIAGSLATAAATVAAVIASLAGGGPGANALLAQLPTAAQISPDAGDAMRGEHVPPAAAPEPAPVTASTPAVVPDPVPAVLQAPAVAPSVRVQALAASQPVAVRVAPAPPAPLLRNMLISAGGSLRTGVGIYTDCSGNTPLTRAVAAIDTCVAGPTYFVGHDPGVFTPLMSMSVGDIITWYDRNGAVHRMRIVSIRDGWASANGAPRPTQRDVVAQFQTCEPYSPSGDYDRIIDTVGA